jgi:hypothetical protein
LYVVIAAAAGLACGAAAALWLARGWRSEEPAAPKAGKAYVVQRVPWQYVDRSEPMRDPEPGGAGFPLKVFSDRAAAEAYRRPLEREARQGENPFNYGRYPGGSFPSLADHTSMPTGEFIAWLEAEGLEPPAGQRQAWLAWEAQKQSHPGRYDEGSYKAWWEWWHENSGRWPAEQRERVWDRLDRVRFYDVVEVDAEP